jgi:aconitate hydratase
MTAVAAGATRLRTLRPLPFRECRFACDTTCSTLCIEGPEACDVVGPRIPRADPTLVAHRRSGGVVQVPFDCRIDIAVEVKMYETGGVLQQCAQDFLENSGI